MHPLLKPHNLFYSDGVAILSGFHHIPQNILIGYTDDINQVKWCVNLKVQKPEKAQLGILEIMYVQYDCNHRPGSFRDLLWKRSVCQNV